MKTECTWTKHQFQSLGRRRVEAAFDGGTVTTDAGALLLRETEEATGIVAKFSACFEDKRDAARVEHTLLELLKQRVFGLCLGYEDLVDHDDLRRDPLLAIACGKRDPSGQRRKRQRDRGAALAGKSTLNRLELTKLDATADERYAKIVCQQEKVERFFVEVFLDSYDQEPDSIVLDMDLTDIPLHGHQEDRFFHGYYDEYCYLPLYIFCGTHVLVALLRPAGIDSIVGLTDVLQEVISQIRTRWTKTHILLRADSGFCREELMSWVEQRKLSGERIDYVLGLAKNSRLLEVLDPALREAHKLYQGDAEPTRVFHEFAYQTLDSWSRSRRVIGKAECLEKGLNPRFIVTSYSTEEFESGAALYEKTYCARGDAENRVKEQQLGLFADRASSSSFTANQVRVWFSACAYTVINAFRRVALRATELATALCSTIRDKLFKIGARVLTSARRIRLMMASGHPRQHIFWAALQNLCTAFPVLLH